MDAIERMHQVIADMSALTADVSSSVDAQKRTIERMADNVMAASHDAEVGAEAITEVDTAAVSAASASASVAALATTLSGRAETLDVQVRDFLQAVRVA
jgi:methyl-accepting chemotaxis protein